MTAVLTAAFAFVVTAGEALPGLGSPAAWVLGAALVGDAALRRRGARGTGVPRALAAWGLLVALAALSLLWSQDPAATRRVALHLGREALLLGALALHPSRPAVLRGLAWGASAGAVVLAASLLGVFLLDADLRGVRVSVGEGEPGVQARALGGGLLLGLAALARATPSRGLLRASLPLLTLVGLGVGLAGSRGAWVAVGVALGAAALRSTQAARRGAVAAALGVCIGVFALGARADVRPPLPGLGSGDVEAITSGRDAIWRNTLSIVAEHPVVGVGAGAVPEAYEPHRLRLEAAGGPTSKPRRDAHSVYLEVWASLGPAGLLALLFGLLAVARDARHAEVRSVLVFGALSGVTLTTWEHASYWLVLGWAALAAGEARASIVSKRSENAASAE